MASSLRAENDTDKSPSPIAAALPEPDRVADNVERCVRTGVAGLSIEDSTGDKDKPIYERGLAVERIKASRKAIGDSGTLLVGRCEAYLWGVTDLKLVIDRLTVPMPMRSVEIATAASVDGLSWYAQTRTVVFGSSVVVEKLPGLAIAKPLGTSVYVAEPSA